MMSFNCMAAVRIRIAWSMLLVLIAVGAVVRAQAPSPSRSPGSIDDTMRVSILSRPSLDPVTEVFRASGLRSAMPTLQIIYDADGLPLNVDVVESSGSRALDRAIVDWAKQIRIAAKEAGTGRLPFSFLDDSLLKGQAPPAISEIKITELAFKPSMVPVMKSFASVNFSEASAEVHLDYDTAGNVVDVRLVESSGSGSLDKAIIAWSKGIKLKSDMAGTGRLPFRFKKP